jgi:hypothetical protein
MQEVMEDTSEFDWIVMLEVVSGIAGCIGRELRWTMSKQWKLLHLLFPSPCPSTSSLPTLSGFQLLLPLHLVP